MSQSAHYDVLVVGGGIVGLTAALALAKTTTLSIAVIEANTHVPAWSQDDYHPRVSAITLASKRILQVLEVWSAVKEKRVSAFKGIEVWNAQHAQQKLQFNSSDINEVTLGYIVENNLLQQVLTEQLATLSNVSMIKQKVSQLRVDSQAIYLTADNGHVYSAKLALGADGANSWLRQAAGLDVSGQDYAESAIVASVTTEKPHDQIARQCFLPSGPLGMLPLSEANRISIVWSQTHSEAERLLAMNAEEFKQALYLASEGVLGNIEQVSERHAFPLKKQHANAYITDRIALLGDAAHVVHPLAGQGVNMGLLDAAALVDVIKTAIDAHKDFSAHRVLRQYERWRKADNSLMLIGIDAIKTFFANKQSMLTTCAAISMSAVNRLPILKNIFTRHAVGERIHLPTLARSPDNRPMCIDRRHR